MKKDLPLVVLVGLTNVGKSSLFNAILGEQRSIIARETHTTRDYVDAILRTNKSAVRLVDSAGLGEADSLAKKANDALTSLLTNADTIVMVVDRSVVISQKEVELARKIKRFGGSTILALNKSDRASRAVSINSFKKLGIDYVIETSATTKLGVKELTQALFTSAPNHVVAEKTYPKIALLGRPNVGKSSLFNKLSGESRAIVDPTAGTTRDMVVSEIQKADRTYELADTAGLRKRGKVVVGIEQFSAVRSKRAIEWADVCLLVLDAAELAVHQDLSLAGTVSEAGRGLILVVNKIDRLDELELTRSQILSRLKREYQFCWWASVVLVSAQDNKNIDKIFDTINQIISNQNRNISTVALNRFLARIKAEHPPASTGFGRAKLNYMTQIDNRPPTFAIYGTKPSQIHFSYRRYIENKLREEFDFSGTPIKLIFKDKHTS